jgi:hypothetical protein
MKNDEHTSMALDVFQELFEGKNYKGKDLTTRFNQYLFSFDEDDNTKSEFLNILLEKPSNEITKGIFNLYKPNLDINPVDILRQKKLLQTAKYFSFWFRQFKTINFDFNFFGLTVDDFKPRDENEKYCQKVLINKLTCYKLINSKLTKIYRQQLELQQIKRGKVSEYMSDVGFNVMMNSKKSVDEYLSCRFIEFGKERKTLLELKENSKTHKMNELCVIKNHINTLVNDGSWGCRFITITNKPEELPRSYNSKDKTHWNGVSTPRDNAVQLQRRWRNIQSYANRNSIPLIGIWCREPHKKGGIHQHILVFTKKGFLESEKTIKAMTKNQVSNKLGLYRAAKKKIISNDDLTIEKLFLKHFGYTNRSCKIDVLKNNKSQNIVNYITKYIMKTIDVRTYNGTSLDNDDNHIHKISFHRTLWNYRAYGFFGFNNSLGLWRFIRKIEKNKNALTIEILKNSILDKALTAVRENDYSSFLAVSEGLNFESHKAESSYGERITKRYGLKGGETVYVFSESVFEKYDVLKKINIFEYLNFPVYEVMTN